MMAKLYDALRAGGVPEDKAREAAEEAAHESRFAKVARDLLLLKWMAGINSVLSLMILIKLLIERAT